MNNITEIIRIINKNGVKITSVKNKRLYLDKLAKSYEYNLCEEELDSLVKYYKGTIIYCYEYDEKTDSIYRNEYYNYYGYSSKALDKWTWLCQNDPAYKKYVF